MLTPLFLGAGILAVLILALSLVCEIIFQFFGRGAKQKLTVISDDEFKKELNIEGGERLLSLLQNNGFNIPAACGGMATCGQCKVKLYTDVGLYTAVETPHFDMRSRENAKNFWKMVSEMVMNVWHVRCGWRRMLVCTCQKIPSM